MEKDKNLDLLRKVAVIIIGFYFGIQIVFSIILFQWPLTGIGLKFFVILQTILPGIAIILWARYNNLLNSDIFPFTISLNHFNIPIIVLFVIGFFLLSEGLSNAVLTLLPEDIVFDLERDVYIPSYNIIKMETSFDLIVIGLGLGIIIPLLNELIFRGLGLNVFRGAVGINKASVYSAALWAFLHMNPVDFLTLLIMGIVLAYITHKTGSLFLPIGIHVIFSLTELIYLNNFEFSELMDLPELYMSVLIIFLSIIFIVAGVRLTDYIYSSD